MSKNNNEKKFMKHCMMQYMIQQNLMTGGFNQQSHDSEAVKNDSYRMEAYEKVQEWVMEYLGKKVQKVTAEYQQIIKKTEKQLIRSQKELEKEKLAYQTLLYQNDELRREVEKQKADLKEVKSILRMVFSEVGICNSQDSLKKIRKKTIKHLDTNLQMEYIPSVQFKKPKKKYRNTITEAEYKELR